MPSQAPRPSLSALVASFALAVAPQTAQAAAPPADLMARLAEYASRFETLRTHCSYEVDGRMVTLDRNGAADSTKELKGRVDSRGEHVEFSVARYTEDGKDQTAEAQKKAREKAQERPHKDKKQARMPILAEEQPRYVFEQLEVDRTDPTRVRIAFVPKAPDYDTIEGSVWVDTKTATILSAGFKMSKTPMFVDYVHFTMEFGAATALGPAVSTVVADGKGGVPFFRKRFHVTATLSDYRILP